MPTCATCGHDNPDGAWTCSKCGQPLSMGGTGGAAGNGEAFEPVRDHNYYEAPTIYGTSAPTIPPLAARPKSGGPSLLKLVLVGGLLAVVAIVAIWFFFLRDAQGAEFVGTWQSMGSDGTTVRIEQSDGDMALYFTALHDDQSAGPFKGEVKDDKLKTQLEYSGNDEVQKANMPLYKEALGVPASGITVVFYFEGDKLFRMVEGKVGKTIRSRGWDVPVELKKVE
jgi:hypothetical protein